jgi:hypothetical protein
MPWQYVPSSRQHRIRIVRKLLLLGMFLVVLWVIIRIIQISSSGGLPGSF